MLAAASVGALVVLVACGPGGRDKGRGQPSARASAGPSAAARASSSAAASASPSASASASAAAAADPAPSNAPVTSFTPFKDVKGCKANSVEVVQYLQRGEISIAAKADRIAVTWLMQVGGRRQEQVAFTSYDLTARSPSRPRGIGLSEHAAPRAFAVGGEWTITWFDENGLAYARPKEDPLPAPDVLHLKAVAQGDADKVALSHASGDALIAAAVLASTKGQVALFQFAPADTSAPAVRALGVTHKAKSPDKPAVTSDANGVTVAWLEPGGRVVGSHFDPAGKERAEPCVVAEASKTPRDALNLVATKGGSVALWQEGEEIYARGLDAGGCPRSPRFDVGKGSFLRVEPAGEGVLAAWVTGDKLVAAKLDAKGAPPASGVEVAVAPGGVKDAPSIAAAGTRAAFAWSEAMGPTVATRRGMLRTLDLACLP
ncbi:MAG TPA: hypothetical protein VGM56_10165 [Byssovorax sp.]|jgi:hypothetical protein